MTIVQSEVKFRSRRFLLYVDFTVSTVSHKKKQSSGIKGTPEPFSYSFSCMFWRGGCWKQAELMFDPIKANLMDSFKSAATFLVTTVSSDEDGCDKVARVAELPRCSMQSGNDHCGCATLCFSFHQTEKPQWKFSLVISD